MNAQKLLSENTDEYIDTALGFVYSHNQNDLYINVNSLGQLQTYSYQTQEIKILNTLTIGLNKMSASFSDFTTIDSMTAFTFVPNKKKFKPIESKDFSIQNNTTNNVFFDDSKTMIAKFNGVTKDAYLQLKYKEVYKDPHLLGLHTYQYGKLCKKNIYRVFVQEGINVSIKHFNFEGFNIDTTSTIQGKYKVYTFIATNIKPYLNKASAPGYLYILPHTTLEVVNYKFNNKTTPILGSTKDLYAWYMLLVKETINKKYPELAHIADSITKEIKKEEDKVKAIYNWVQNQISYVAFEHGLGGFIPRPADLVCSRKFGDCKDMAMLIFKLLESINIKAGITWIGSTELPYKYSELNSPLIDNHMITTYKNTKGEWVFLDATSKYCLYGLPSNFTQNKEALIYINDTTFEIATVPVVNPSINQNIDSVKITFNKDELIFNGNNTLTGYCKSDVDYYFDNYINNKGKEITQSILKKGSDKFSIDTFYYKNNDIFSKLFYKAKLPGYTVNAGKRMFINTNFTKDYLEDIIDTSAQFGAVDLKQTITRRLYQEIELPKNYSIESLPKSKELGNKYFSISLNYKQIGNTIICDITYIVKDILVIKKDVYMINDFVEKAKKLHKENLILIRND